jgi:hypothetical protein
LALDPPVRQGLSVGQSIVSLRLDPAEGTVNAGDGVQMNLFGATRKGNTSLIPANLVRWSSSSHEVAEVNRQGRLNPRRAGRVTITAHYGGHVANAVFVVVALN